MYNTYLTPQRHLALIRFRNPTLNLRKAIYLRFVLEKFFSFNINFSPVILKGIIHPQSSQNEILIYSP